MRLTRFLSSAALAAAIALASGVASAQPWWWDGDGNDWPMHGRGSGMMHGWGSGMGPGMMGPGMAPMMFVLMDTDGDGAVSWEEIQAVHKRMFDLVDKDKDGKITVEEMHAYWGVDSDDQ
jgi:hypothetical protein